MHELCHIRELNVTQLHIEASCQTRKTQRKQVPTTTKRNKFETAMCCKSSVIRPSGKDSHGDSKKDCFP